MKSMKLETKGPDRLGWKIRSKDRPSKSNPLKEAGWYGNELYAWRKGQLTLIKTLMEERDRSAGDA